MITDKIGVAVVFQILPVLAYLNALASVRENPKPPSPVKTAALRAASILYQGPGFLIANPAPKPSRSAHSKRITIFTSLTRRSTPDPTPYPPQSGMGDFRSFLLPCSRRQGVGPVSLALDMEDITLPWH